VAAGATGDLLCAKFANPHRSEKDADVRDVGETTPSWDRDIANRHVRPRSEDAGNFAEA
jgi:hypothetical protein